MVPCNLEREETIMKLTLEEAQKMMKSCEGNLDLYGAKVDELPNNLTVGGWLDLRNTPIKELPDNLTVGGELNLVGTQIEELPDNLTVGGWLDLVGTQIEELPDNLRVARMIYFGDGSYIKGDLKDGTVTDDYIYADNILTHIKKVVQKGNYTYYVGKIKGKNVIYDGKNYAHCLSFKKGVEDLRIRGGNSRLLVSEMKASFFCFYLFLYVLINIPITLAFLCDL